MLIALIAIVFASCFYLYGLARDCHRAYKGRGVLYSLKVFMGRLQLVGGFIASIYVAILGGFILPAFVEYWGDVYQPFNAQGEFLYYTMPLFVICLIVVIMMMPIIISARWWIWGLTDEEKAYEKAESIKRKHLFHERLDKYPKWFRWILLH